MHPSDALNVLVLGGGSGASAARLASRLGHKVSLYESNETTVADLRAEGFVVHAGAWSLSLLDGIDLVITAPGFSEHSEPIRAVIEAGIPLVSEVEFASRHLNAPYVAVTGTNGKTTVTTLVADMLAASGLRTVAAGNIGLAVSDIVADEWDAIAIEVSSFQLRFIDQFAPRVAVVLNIADDHIDWHGSQERYAMAKRRIVENQRDHDILVYDLNDPGARRVASAAGSRTIAVSGTHSTDAQYGRRDGELVLPGISIPIVDLPVDDAAFLLDMAVAAVAASYVGATVEAISSVLTSFAPVRHRRTVVGTWDGVTWVNDSKATNPHSAVAAAASYPSVVLIAGGRNKGLDLTELATQPTVKVLIAIGEAADELLAASTGPAERAGSIEDAIRIAAEVAEPGDTVLLAPGCASFDMFENYEVRGAVFEETVAQHMRSAL